MWWCRDGMISWGYWGLGLGIIGGLFMLLFWGLILAGLFLLVRRLWSHASSGGSVAMHESPLDILQRRYARGEIGKEEYDRIRRDLS